MSEDEITQLEERVPALASLAFSKAREEALAAGLSVVETEGEFLVRLFPDGKKEVLKRIQPAISVVCGTRIALRK